MELCWDLAEDLFQCHKVDAWWYTNASYMLDQFIYSFDYRPKPSQLYATGDSFRYPDATWTYGVRQN